MKVLERKASDNKYLHRDFHISMNMMMEYICAEFGEPALTDYLREFAHSFHSQRTECLKTRGIECLEDYFKGIYKKEEWVVDISLEKDVLVIKQDACPGIAHIRSKGFEPVKQYYETYSTVYAAMCEGTPYEYSLEGFNLKTGACVQRFKRRAGK